MIRTLFIRPSQVARRVDSATRSLRLTPFKSSDMSAMTNSLESLKRWSTLKKGLPPVEKIGCLHVYDFDNTLFASPLPNKQLWPMPTVSLLQSQSNFVTGGWWHDPAILKCTGEGAEKEEPRGWQGWWNEQIVELVELTMQQPDALNVLLTGRSERGFADIVQKMTDSRNLDFDMFVLRPQLGPDKQEFRNTMSFKQAFLEQLIYTYKDAHEVKIYEDRPRHAQEFRDFLHDINDSLKTAQPPFTRKPFTGEVIEVTENSTTLDPVVECAEVQRMINATNQAFREDALGKGAYPLEITKAVAFTAYLMSPADSHRLLEVAGLPTKDPGNGDMRTMATGILITPRPCPQNILDTVGGMGKKLRWRATALGSYENRIFAAKVEPIPATAQIHSNTSTPLVVLALKGNSRPFEAGRISQWQPLPQEKMMEFETTVGERVTLRVEREQPPAEQQQSNQGVKRSWQGEEFPPLGQAQVNQSGTAGLPQGTTQNTQVNSQQHRRAYHTDENRRSNGGAPRGMDSWRPDPMRNGPSKYDGRDGRNGRGSRRGRGGSDNNGGGGGGRNRGRGGQHGYRSLDDQAGRKKNNQRTDGTNNGGLSY